MDPLTTCGWCHRDVANDHRVLVQVDHIHRSGAPGEGVMVVLCQRCAVFLDNAVLDAKRMLPWVRDEQGPDPS